MIVSKKDIEYFLSTTKFSGYQSVPLPYGLSVPGTDRSVTADVIFGSWIANKTVLEVGTYYGFFPNEAMRRGASLAVGVEGDIGRSSIAKRISELNGDRYNIIQAKVEDLNLKERFDVVLFLNVLHHVIDPISVIHKLADYCKETLIVEFCLADDYDYICHLYSKSKSPTIIHKIRARIQSLMLRVVAHRLPLMAVGNREYHRTFYFTQDAFYNLFVVHHKLFDSIEFVSSGTRSRRVLAFCKLSKCRKSTDI